LARSPSKRDDTTPDLDRVRSKTVVTSINRITEHPPTKEACLVVIYGVGVGRKFDLFEDVVSIGRDQDNTIVLESDAVSRRHARIERQGDQRFITDLNKAMEDLCGKDREVLMESRLESLFVNPTGLEQTIKICFARGKVTGSPHRISLASGETIPVLLNVIAYRDRSDGLVHGALVCLEPINNSVFNDLMQSQRYARSLIEASLDALVFLDLDGTILDVNEATVKIVGLDREGLIGSNFADYFTEPKKARDGIQETLRNGAVRNFELMLVDKGSHRIPVQFNATAYREDDGAIKGVFAAARDVRETKSMIAELEGVKDYSRGLIESSLDMMVTVDSDCRIMDVNEAATLLVEKSREELIGQEAARVSRWRNPAESAAFMARMREQGTCENLEIVSLPKHGPEVIGMVSARLITMHDQPHILSVTRDITARRLVEQEKADLDAQNQQLQKAESLGRMAGAIAHHFNNQLHAVVANLELLGQPLADTDASRFLARAKQATERAVAMSSLMLAYLGQTSREQEPCDLAELCQSGLADFQARLPENVALNVAFPQPGPIVRVNADQIRQILSNLATNALEALGPAGGGRLSSLLPR